jgi:hypothetical protein
MLAIQVAIQRRTVSCTADRPRTLVLFEPIRTTMRRAANAVGIAPIRVRILSARRIDLANADANNGHAQRRMNAELIANNGPREQAYPTTVTNAGQA